MTIKRHVQSPKPPCHRLLDAPSCLTAGSSESGRSIEEASGLLPAGAMTSAAAENCDGGGVASWRTTDAHVAAHDCISCEQSNPTSAWNESAETAAGAPSVDARGEYLQGSRIMGDSQSRSASDRMYDRHKATPRLVDAGVGSTTRHRTHEGGHFRRISEVLHPTEWVHAAKRAITGDRGPGSLRHWNAATGSGPWGAEASRSCEGVSDFDASVPESLDSMNRAFSSRIADVCLKHGVREDIVSLEEDDECVGEERKEGEEERGWRSWRRDGAWRREARRKFWEWWERVVYPGQLIKPWGR